MEKGNVRNVEIQLRTKEDVIVDCLVSAETITIQGKACVLNVLQDITERKRSEEELMAAIEAVMQDTSWFSRTVIEKLANLRQPRGSNRPTFGLADLTTREREVLGLICRGLADKEIAKALDLALNTVRNHVATVYRKIGVHRRSAAVIWARERGFIGEEWPRPKPRSRRAPR